MIRSEQRTSENRVRDYMVPDPATVPFEATIMDALKAMVGRDRNTVLVMDGDDVVGAIAAEDIARLVAKGVDLQDTSVRDFVTACLLTGNQPCVQIRDGDTVLNALKVMDSWTATQIIVVNENNKVVGTISALDALKGWMEEVSGA